MLRAVLLLYSAYWNYPLHVSHEQVKGELEWNAAGVDFHARELSALVISPDGKRARFEGVATDGRRFEVAVEDDGKKDRFQLWLEGVLLTPDPVLTGGSIQIHQG